MSQQLTQSEATAVEKPSLAALLKQVIDDEDAPNADDRERYVHEDEDGYAG